MSPEPSDFWHYDLLAPAKIAFGWGRRRELGALARGLGSRALVVSGKHTLDRAHLGDELAALLAEAGIALLPVATIDREPTADDVDRAVAACQAHGVCDSDFVLAIGGGAALDLGKALAGLARAPAPVRVAEFLEGQAAPRPLAAPVLPLLAMPTTAGTGSEATKNAVITLADPPAKRSLRSERLIPRVALVDPALTLSLPRAQTAASGLDAITQLVESYLSRKARPIPRSLALAALADAVPALPRALADGDDRAARIAMAHAALVSGICLANSGLGVAHGVAAGLGAVCGTAHGLACGTLLPLALKVNAEVCAAEMAELARRAWNIREPLDRRAAMALIAEVAAYCHRCGAPQRLRDLGVAREQLPAVVLASQGNSLSGNPRAIALDELAGLLEEFW